MSHLSIARLTTLTLLVLAGALAPAAQAQYTVPPDNPFVSNPLARGEIYVYGMRNPYRWSFDRLNGDMWIGDVGGSNPDQEEITHLSAASIAGANLG
jgi:glucose/arabinose dehydrogenase